MRITYLHQYFNTPEMSGGTRSYELGRRLVAMGHDVNMITSWRTEGDHRESFETKEAGIRVHWLPVPYNSRMGYSQRVMAFLAFARKSAQMAASIEADVVFATSTPLTIALPAMYAARRQSIPMVFEVRDLWPDVPWAMGFIKSRLLYFLAERLEKFAYHSAVHVVALTPTMRDFISGKGIALEKITSIPNLSNVDDLQPGPNPEAGGHSKLLYCGSLGPAHGPEYLVELAKIFFDQGLDIRIDVVGAGSLQEVMLEQCSVLGVLNKTIAFHGAVAKSRIGEFYGRSHATIMTMADCELLYRHSVQNKFFDSLAAGKPVFANYRGYASELAEVEGAGMIVDPYDVGRAAVQIATFLADPERVRDSGQRARALAEREFHADRLAERLEAVFNDALGASSKRRSGRA